MDQETPPPPPPPPSDSALTSTNAVVATLTHDLQPGSTSVPELSLEGNSAAPSHGIQRAGPSFLDLPAEIRNIIYTWLFPTGRSAVQLLARHRGGYIDMGECLGLLTTCRQVYDEVSSLLRTEHRFVVVQPKTIVDMLYHYHAEGSREISRRIMNYICPHDVQLHYDIDKRTTEKSGPPLFDVCKKLRKLCNFLIYMKVTVSVSYPFRGLEEWARSVYDYIEETRSSCLQITLTLRLPKTDSNGNAAFYLPAARIFRAIKDLIPWRIFKVVAADEDEANVKASIDLTTICHNLIVLVYHLLKLSPDPFHQPTPPIWIDTDLRVSHAEIECEDGRIMHVPYSREYTSDEVHEKASHLIEFFNGTPFSNTEAEDAATPELAGYTPHSIYAKDTLITLAQEVAGVCYFLSS